MKSKELELKGNRVLVVDAPMETTHSNIGIHDGGNFILYKKSKILSVIPFDESKADSAIHEEYEYRLVNVGKLETAQNGVIDDLFDMVKRRKGHFYDYAYNGVFYPTSKSALKDVISMELGFANPFVLIIKPQEKNKTNLLADTLESQ